MLSALNNWKKRESLLHSGAPSPKFNPDGFSGRRIKTIEIADPLQIDADDRPKWRTTREKEQTFVMQLLSPTRSWIN
jgi:hypothetical protein